MLILWGTLAGLLLYLEFIYHFVGFGQSGFRPLYAALLIMAWAGAETLLTGVLRGRLKKAFYRLSLWIPVVWTGAQLVYLRIFKQPLLMEAAFRSGGEALTNYWREALAGIYASLPFLVLLILPAILLPIVLKKCKWELPDFSSLQVMRTILLIVVGVVGSSTMMTVGKSIQAEYYEDYHEFYDPLTVTRTLGLLPTLQRDTIGRATLLFAELWKQDKSTAEGSSTALTAHSAETAYPLKTFTKNFQESEGTGSCPNTPNSVSGDAVGENPGANGADIPEEQPPHPQQFTLDYELLHALADNNNQLWLADYIEEQTPVNSNEYTGIFEGYNLIYLTAEGFSSYAVNEELTPTLYRLSHTGFVFENFYVPLWQTSTSDGEYINCTGLIPDGQYSMRKSSEKDMAYTLPKFFAAEGVSSYAYHNNSMDYYDRHLSHPNLGYDFKASLLGGLSAQEWGDKIFPMEHPNLWPASDLEMMEGTMPDYIGQERFHVYYMTVSGHMNYSFIGNSMSGKNKEAVSGLEMSENARAYIACNIELDKALEYILAQLEAAGQLERTVICLSADHYPYGMTMDQYEELAGKSLSGGLDLYRNTLILWNVGMEDTPVYIQKACGSMDILPTLLNLFGFPYDSRMYAGRDILADGEGMVIFSDRSFVTDSVIYKRGSDAIWLQDDEGNDLIPDEQKEAYLNAKKQEVKDRYQFSAYILREDYYQDVEQAVVSS